MYDLEYIISRLDRKIDQQEEILSRVFAENKIQPGTNPLEERRIIQGQVHGIISECFLEYVKYASSEDVDPNADIEAVIKRCSKLIEWGESLLEARLMAGRAFPGGFGEKASYDLINEMSIYLNRELNYLVEGARRGRVGAEIIYIRRKNEVNLSFFKKFKRFISGIWKDPVLSKVWSHVIIVLFPIGWFVYYYEGGVLSDRIRSALKSLGNILKSYMHNL